MKVDWRSLLFVSADDSKRVARVHMRGADAVILDLEDAVPEDRKPFARAALAETITSLHGRDISVIIRVNADWLNLIEDLHASVLAGVTAIMLPKVDAAWRVGATSEIITELESRAGLEALKIGIIALIEDASGLAVLDDIARQDRFIGFALGSEDFALSMGVAPTPQLLDYATKRHRNAPTEIIHSALTRAMKIGAHC